MSNQNFLSRAFNYFFPGGQPSQIVKFNSQEGKFEIDHKTLSKILNKPDTYDLPICIISLSGPTRVGKSLTLSYIIEFLKKRNLSLSDDPVLDNFKWKCGSKRETIGMYAWSELITVETRRGGKVAVMLIDTQGLFDGETSELNEAKMFAFSTMLSSVQVYNVQRALRTDKLKCFSHFIEYGKQIQALSTQESSVPFQSIYYVVRDWEDTEEYSPGVRGGQAYYQREFHDDNQNRPPDQAEMRTAIEKCFQKSSCCLLSHPGRQVSKQTFRGSTLELERDFFESLREFIQDLLNPDALPVKMHEGKMLKAYDVPRYVGVIADAVASQSDDLASVVKKSLAGGIVAEASSSIIGMYIESITNFIYETESLNKHDLRKKDEELRKLGMKTLEDVLRKKLGSDAMPDLEKVESEIFSSIDVVYIKTVETLWERVVRDKQQRRQDFQKTNQNMNVVTNMNQEVHLTAPWVDHGIQKERRQRERGILDKHEEVLKLQLKQQEELLKKLQEENEKLEKARQESAKELEEEKRRTKQKEEEERKAKELEEEMRRAKQREIEERKKGELEEERLRAKQKEIEEREARDRQRKLEDEMRQEKAKMHTKADETWFGGIVNRITGWFGW